jgi:hypothetical protein
MTRTHRRQVVADRVGDFGSWLFGELDELGAVVAEQLSVPQPRRADLDIEGRCLALLTDPDTPVAGAGVVMAPGVLVDAAYWLEWWTVDATAGYDRCTKLAAETDPRAVGFRDYTELPWYQRPLTTGGRHVTGPYVDYLCTDQYTLTFTQPLVVGGEFAGVVGADVLVAWLERHLLDVLAEAEGTCILVNAVGRVVTSSDPTWVTGDLVRGLPLDAWFAGESAPHDEWEFTPCGSLPLAVLSRPGQLTSSESSGSPGSGVRGQPAPSDLRTE